MFNFIVLQLFCLLLLFTTTNSAQPYKATEHFLLDCGSSNTTTISDQKWDGDERSEYVPSNITRTSFASTPVYLDTSVPHIPYSTARIFNTSSFTYKFHVSPGPKFLRLYFYPATYSGLSANYSFFSVSSNGYYLLTNFSPFLTASFLSKTRSDAGLDSPSVPHFVKEFLIYVTETQILQVTFTPSPNSYAFINGIEIVSMPENLYFNAKNVKYVGQNSGPVINNKTALENVYRLNMGGGQIPGNDDTGMFRSWDQDNSYIYGSIGLTPVYENPITYTVETPNYTAPEPVYQTQRSMGPLAKRYNLTWILPVDSGFYYMLRLHFCNIIPQYTKGQMFFKIFINNQTAEEEADLFYWTQGSGYPVYKDYVVFVTDPDGHRSKQDLWLAMHPNPKATIWDANLNGLEAFKLSMVGNLSSPNPQVSPTKPPSSLVLSSKRKKKSPPYAMVVGGVIGGLVLLSIVLLIVLRQRKRVNHHSTTNQKLSRGSTPSDSSLPSDRSRRFTLTEVKAATNNFNDNCVIGNGGFGKVYKGYVDNAATTVAIKSSNPSSSQGFHEFHTEIEMLSKLRHVHLVSLIGYCNENGEMVLVYDYMTHGTLREHLYKTNNPLLSWETRLNICIGAAKGLHYLHTGAKRTIIHRDVKSTNILLDENWVAKVSDFGLSKVGSRDPLQKHVSTMVKGSIGYMDPEYCRNKKLTEKSDVYSFGVVLFEVLCARPPIIPRVRDEQVNLAEWGKTCYRRGTLVEIIDEKISDQIAPGCLRKFGEVANSCLHPEGCERPAMDEVVWGLEFALELQKGAQKIGGNVSDAMSENQEVSFLIQEEVSTMNDNGIENKGNVAEKSVPQ
ncbi:receptor-like protein kinase FERONIA [Tanacetum coccineum]